MSDSGMVSLLMRERCACGAEFEISKGWVAELSQILPGVRKGILHD